MDDPLAEIRIARQPIYDRNLEVCGYELLYRQGEATTAEFVDGDAATASVMGHALLSMNFQQLTAGKPAYINLTRRFFVEDLVPFGRDQVVLELLEDTEPDEELQHALRRIARQGYAIALDDYVLGTDQRHKLFPYINLIKVDVLNLSFQEVVQHAKRLRRPGGPALLAEKVEDQRMLDLCHKAGFAYFQGFFLSRPATLTGRTLDAGRLHIMQLLSGLYRPEVDLREIEHLITHDLALSYKLLRYLQSPVFAARGIDSVRSAVLYLGRRELAHWALLLALASNQNQPAEQLRSLLIRARVCTQLTRNRYGGSDPDAAFTVGLFSGLDAVFDLPIERVCEQLPMSPEVSAALTRREGPYGRVLSAAIAQEQGAWDQLAGLEIPGQQINHFYIDAVKWADAHYAQLAQTTKAA
ncbi:EAL and HDOD domain-containing protein [Halorhodospira halophila]|uniref:EAL and HDOD domain-containing protein n=1 Tax=Halorhodospira halophila TaxID=1053 RepID=UPI001914412D|nr:HDOD domain-containing protein [Halorhodospira halophila]MBK5935563.1 hypothetical protein [Halorhodospira halophila]